MRGIDIVFVGLLVMLLIPIAATDMKERRIPNGLNLALGLLGFVHAMVVTPEFNQAVRELLTGTVAGLAFAGTAWIIQRLNRRARIGWGDLKFLTAASLWVGMKGSMAILFAASVITLLVALLSMPWKPQSWREPRPFGPMLAAGMLAVVVMTCWLDAKS
jgi:leader peptidase (prepilin peptidase)/N-methyltransferase